MRVWSVIAVIAGILVLTAVAFALPNDLSTFKSTYTLKEGTKLAGAACLICHDKMPPSKTALNPYGKDLAKQAKPFTAASFKAIEKLDSDKDGFTNLQEIQAGTLPGDPTSKPVK